MRVSAPHGVVCLSQPCYVSARVPGQERFGGSLETMRLVLALTTLATWSCLSSQELFVKLANSQDSV